MLAKDLKEWLENVPDDADIIIQKTVRKGETIVAGVEGVRFIPHVKKTKRPRAVIYNNKTVKNLY